MKLNVDNELLSDVGLDKMDINVNSLTFKALVSGIYEDKLGSVIREISTNALDSHVQANNKDPFSIKITTTDHNIVSEIVIQDFGLGLTEEESREYLCTVNSSSKRDRDDVVGAFGIGSKSVLSITDQYTFTCVKDNIETNILISTVDDGTPHYIINSKENMEAPNGVTCTIPLGDNYNYNDVIDKIKRQLLLFPIKPKVFVDERETIIEWYEVEEYEDFYYAPHLYSESAYSYLAIGPIVYKVSFATQIRLFHTDKGTTIFKGTYDEFKFNESRELIQDTPSSRENFVKLMCEFLRSYDFKEYSETIHQVSSIFSIHSMKLDESAAILLEYLSSLDRGRVLLLRKTLAMLLSFHHYTSHFRFNSTLTNTMKELFAPSDPNNVLFTLLGSLYLSNSHLGHEEFLRFLERSFNQTVYILRSNIESISTYKVIISSGVVNNSELSNLYVHKFNHNYIIVKPNSSNSKSDLLLKLDRIKATLPSVFDIELVDLNSIDEEDKKFIKKQPKVVSNISSTRTSAIPDRKPLGTIITESKLNYNNRTIYSEKEYTYKSFLVYIEKNPVILVSKRFVSTKDSYNPFLSHKFILEAFNEDVWEELLNFRKLYLEGYSSKGTNILLLDDIEIDPDHAEEVYNSLPFDDKLNMTFSLYRDQVLKYTTDPVQMKLIDNLLMRYFTPYYNFKLLDVFVSNLRYYGMLSPDVQQLMFKLLVPKEIQDKLEDDIKLFMLNADLGEMYKKLKNKDLEEMLEGVYNEL